MHKRPEAFDLVDMNDGLLVFVDEWREYAPFVMQDLITLPREDLNFVKYWLEFLRLRTGFSSEHTKRFSTRTDECHRITGGAFPA